VDLTRITDPDKLMDRLNEVGAQSVDGDDDHETLLELVDQELERFGLQVTVYDCGGTDTIFRIERREQSSKKAGRRIERED
jgi:hypothetical protein